MGMTYILVVFAIGLAVGFAIGSDMPFVRLWRTSRGIRGH
jgi:hypothetical protein